MISWGCFIFRWRDYLLVHMGVLQIQKPSPTVIQRGHGRCVRRAFPEARHVDTGWCNMKKHHNKSLVGVHPNTSVWISESCYYLNHKWHAGWWFQPTPLKHMSSLVGMMTFPIYGNIKHVPNHPPDHMCCLKTKLPRGQWKFQLETHFFLDEAKLENC